jgi:hypothetical protein
MTTMYLLLFTCTVQYNDIYDRPVRKSGVLQRLVRTVPFRVDLEPSGVTKLHHSCSHHTHTADILTSHWPYIYKRDYVIVTLLCHIYDLAMRKI